MLLAIFHASHIVVKGIYERLTSTYYICLVRKEGNNGLSTSRKGTNGYRYQLQIN